MADQAAALATREDVAGPAAEGTAGDDHVHVSTSRPVSSSSGRGSVLTGMADGTEMTQVEV